MFILNLNFFFYHIKENKACLFGKFIFGFTVYKCLSGNNEVLMVFTSSSRSVDSVHWSIGGPSGRPGPQLLRSRILFTPGAEAMFDLVTEKPERQKPKVQKTDTLVVEKMQRDGCSVIKLHIQKLDYPETSTVLGSTKPQ